MQINALDFIPVLNVDKQVARLITHSSFWFSINRYGMDNLILHRIDNREIIASTVTGDDASGKRIVQNSVGIFSGGDSTQNMMCPYIHHAHFVALAIADIGFMQSRNKRNSMYSMQRLNGGYFR